MNVVSSLSVRRCEFSAHAFNLVTMNWQRDTHVRTSMRLPARSLLWLLTNNLVTLCIQKNYLQRELLNAALRSHTHQLIRRASCPGNTYKATRSPPVKKNWHSVCFVSCCSVIDSRLPCVSLKGGHKLFMTHHRSLFVCEAAVRTSYRLALPCVRVKIVFTAFRILGRAPLDAAFFPCHYSRG